MLALKMLVGVGRVGVTEKGGNEAHMSEARTVHQVSRVFLCLLLLQQTLIIWTRVDSSLASLSPR